MHDFARDGPEKEMQLCPENMQLKLFRFHDQALSRPIFLSLPGACNNCYAWQTADEPLVKMFCRGFNGIEEGDEVLPVPCFDLGDW